MDQKFLDIEQIASTAVDMAVESCPVELDGADASASQQHVQLSYKALFGAYTLYVAWFNDKRGRRRFTLFESSFLIVLVD